MKNINIKEMFNNIAFKCLSARLKIETKTIVPEFDHSVGFEKYRRI